MKFFWNGNNSKGMTRFRRNETNTEGMTLIRKEWQSIFLFKYVFGTNISPVSIFQSFDRQTDRQTNTGLYNIDFVF
jgi:hypothetical protein